MYNSRIPVLRCHDCGFQTRIPTPKYLLENITRDSLSSYYFDLQSMACAKCGVTMTAVPPIRIYLDGREDWYKPIEERQPCGGTMYYDNAKKFGSNGLSDYLKKGSRGVEKRVTWIDGSVDVVISHGSNVAFPRTGEIDLEGLLK